MKNNQLTKGQSRRLMYIEAKDGLIDGRPARIGWVEFSKSGRSVYYRGLALSSSSGQGVRGNFIDAETGSEYWISGVKKRGSNTHPRESVIKVEIDEDAVEAYSKIRERT